MLFSSFLKSSLFVAGAVAPLLVAAAGDGPSDVIDLTSDNFEKLTTGESLVLVEFFAPWCGHCKSLAPHYEESATALKEKGITLAKVDCVDQADLCSENGIQGYPTLKVYKNGTPTDYNGPRQADGIISYMVKQSLPAVSIVDAKNHDEFTKADKVVILAYTTESDPLAKTFAAVAEAHRDDYLFGTTSDESLFAAAKVTPPAIVLYKEFDEGRNDLTTKEFAAATEESLAKWIETNAVPLLDEISGDNYAMYAQSGLPLAYLFLDPSKTAEKDTIIEEVTPLAAKYKGEINFVWIDAVKFVEHGKALTLSGEQWPAFVIQEVSSGQKFPLDQKKEATTGKAIETFLSSYKSGDLKPSLKTQDEPVEQDQPYFQLVGSTFEEKVMEDDSRDILLQFSASWCGHCKRLLPTWEELATKYAPVSDKLLIAKMDGAENDIPASAGFSITGFPTIKFKAAGTKEFIDYEGDRSLDSLVDFLNTHAKNDVSLDKAATGGSSAKAAPKATAVADDAHDEL